jgi:phage terminase large subunit GpA-like protein
MFFETLAEIFAHRDYRQPWEWAEDNVWVDKMSTIAPGRYRADTAPWTKEILEAFANPEVSEISVMCAAQSGKTQALLVALAWIIAEDPAPTMWVMANQADAEDFMETRLFPTIERCPPIARMMPKKREGLRKMTIDFAPMPLFVRGAGSPAKLQSVPIRWLFLDEVRNYPPGALDTVRKRTRGQWSSKTVLISTPSNENDIVHQSFLEGSQNKLRWKCVACGEPWFPKWEDLTWEDSERTHLDGRWFFDTLADTIRLMCPNCNHAHADTPIVRKRLIKTAEWVPQNPRAPKHKVSFTWSAIIPPWIAWKAIVEEFLTAKRQMSFGNFMPMKMWRTETMGEPWVDLLQENTSNLISESTATDYELGKVNGGRVFISADVQQNSVWFVVREWFTGGDSRLIEYGQVNDIDELATIADRYNVRKGDVLIDSGYNTQSVYASVIKNGGQWKATKGHDSTGYMVGNVRQPFMYSRADAMVGRGEKKYVILIVFSNPLLKDALAHLISGNGPKWEFSKSVAQNYISQLTAERREERVDARGAVTYFWRQIRKDNHLFDCEVLQLLAALATKILGSSAVTVDEEPNE